ncbi:MAG: alpha/beta fold hydrolase [Marmoricola sp.]
MSSIKRVGEGDHAVVCLHGWFGSAEGWGYLPEVVDQLRFSYWFPEMRGYGARRDETGDYTMKEYAADALAAVDELGLDRFSVLGHSMGGKAAACLLALAQDRVRALVGVAPVAPAPVPLDEAGRGLFFGAPESDQNRRAIIDFTTGGRNSGAWLDDMVSFSRASSTEAAFAGAVESWVNDDYLEDVGRPETPIACLVGENDPAMSAEVMRQSWMQIYPHVELVELPSCGHYPMYETPVWLATRIETFLSDK